ncbi:hypothetical protein GLOIN_2v1475507 [Rhizophagus irregularis DAOM 181602=DAOM 197198]|uniref:Uncharacterized protein n=1 Tax=Rhizophagus irregularis (strain DAOM 181602 / DAOM 197198 / MUCL 43194) TaxID=747089 RepID=A0A2P4QCR8_RHIID|nr:hypothetical protein GLOIN_2v1475507 [Rhizophagus irregularis DAOM 181602=DAOM 197198]POG75425.1 hypothetical protein GLOIN_2v1475507 [Rhizophagus irregularis DAOM 181602=DAOM 197198]CAG8741493.1 77_t:CDS:2 [Rhizophagus irregularis]|eukprot:XP_025182291.1 hypothetical protein GLOIN_2v1475507 [Rhizophagus irregularis DAOM 181602=DAOM 197198]
MDLNIEQLNILRDWPTDSTIRDYFKDSFSVAMELCEALGIDVPSENNLNLTYVEPIILIQNQVDNDISMDNEIINELPVDEDPLLKENDISTAIEIALKQTGFLSLSDDDIVKLDVGDLAKQVDVIVQNTRSNLTPVNNDDVNLSIQYTLTDGQLNLVEMIEIRVKHEAYSSKKLERKYRGEQIANNSDPGIINPNKASHMVAHLINNENPETRFVTQREKRWMINRKTMATKLVQQHREDLAKNKNKKKRNVNSVICEIPNIDCANVNTDNPLSNNQFVIAIFGLILCIARVIAMYYEVYNYHSYHVGEVTDLDSLSYITLHVFLPIHYNIFSGLTNEKSKIFTHHQPDNIVYHLANIDVIVTESSLSLKGFGKIIYNYFNRDDIKEAIVKG